jgi:DNA polymerase (family 10)
LPRLVEIGDIKGDLQMHTSHTDGKNTIAEMVKACRDRGYTYMAITDHTEAVHVAGGLTRAGFRKQFRELDRVQRRARGSACSRAPKSTASTTADWI